MLIIEVDKDKWDATHYVGPVNVCMLDLPDNT